MDSEVQAQEKPRNYTPGAPLIQIASSIGIGMTKQLLHLTFEMPSQYWDGDKEKTQIIIEGSFKYPCEAYDINVYPQGETVTVDCWIKERI